MLLCHLRIETRYQVILSKDIVEAMKDGIMVRVIAGEALGVKSPIYTRTPTMYLDFTLKPGSHLQQLVPKSWNALYFPL
ncbi:pirin protein [Trifolium repens]|nr:pirin protein [Trifolium repens]